MLLHDFLENVVIIRFFFFLVLAIFLIFYSKIQNVGTLKKMVNDFERTWNFKFASWFYFASFGCYFDYYYCWFAIFQVNVFFLGALKFDATTKVYFKCEPFKCSDCYCVIFISTLCLTSVDLLFSLTFFNRIVFKNAHDFYGWTRFNSINFIKCSWVFLDFHFHIISYTIKLK